MPTEAEPLVHTCQKCATLLDISAMEPFSQIYCPNCGELMRVRTRFDHFELLELIATGGMGTVYRALDVSLNRTVALKLLRKEFSNDTDYIEKLETEAKITASVSHPFVVKVFSFGCDQSVYYIAMELVDKGSLDDLMTSQGRIAEAQVLEIALQVTQGLRAAYRAGLIHRDVKPGNILFADAHTAKIVDFGLALPLDHTMEAGGDIWGTPYYVAPEKLNHDPEDFRSDIYSLGGTLFHALAGKPPFDAENASLVALKHLKSQAVSLQAVAPDISSPTAYVINRMLAKNPKDRYQSYDELIEHLEYARSQLSGQADKAHQSKTRVVVEDEKQQSLLGFMLVAAIVFILVMGGVLYAFKDKIINQHSGVEELARKQMEHSLNSVEQTLAQARKQTAGGNPDAALKTLEPLSARQSVPESLKVWVPMHECIARLVAGQFPQSGPIVSKLLQTQAYKTGDRNDDERMHNFLLILQSVLNTKEKVDVPENANARWSTNQFESIGLLIVGLKEWNGGRFDSANGFFQKFLETKPIPQWAWMDDFKPLAKAYCTDFATAQNWLAQADASNTPEKKQETARQISALKAKLKLPGMLPERLHAYETALKPAP